MKPIDKLEGNVIVSYDNFTGLIDEIHFKPFTDKLNQLISSHNELIKIIESFYKEKVIYCIDDKLNKGQ